jgi:uncharacterized protein (TIGR03663 family)
MPWRTRVSLGLALLLAAIALIPRFVLLDVRPLMHDESLFAYYSFIFMERGEYTHFPLLHGPVQILLVGSMFDLLGDSIVVGRATIALLSLVALSACLGLLPRRYRWWAAPLLLSSPILLYYSRFLRNEMIFNALLMLGMLGLVNGLSAPRRRAGWAFLGLAAAIVLIAVKENALFVYAAAVTFAAVWAVHRWIMPRLVTSLRSPRAIVPTPAEPESRRRRAVRAGAWAGGALLGFAVVAALYGVTLAPSYRQDAIRAVVGEDSAAVSAVLAGRQSLSWSQKSLVLGRLMGKSWRNAKASWDYWKGQHVEHRMSGSIHYHLPILLTYELPILLLLLAGFVWDAAQRRSRAGVYAGACLLWLLIWAAWLAVNKFGPPTWLVAVQEFLHIAPDGSMLTLGFMIAPMLAWSVLCLGDRRILAAWMGWWAACSLFQYSSAGEKVPWLAVHIVLPFYMTLVWLWAPRLERLGRRGQIVALAVVAGVALIALRNDFYLVGKRAADPRERLVYNHTTAWFQDLARNRLARWREVEDRIPLRERNVVLVGGPHWPGVWYFRRTRYQLLAKDAPLTLEPEIDLLVGEAKLVEPLEEQADPEKWVPYRGSQRDHWWAPWPEEAKWRARGQPQRAGTEPPEGFFDLLGSSAAGLWRYYWLRETWTDPGGFPLVALEPRCIRR